MQVCSRREGEIFKLADCAFHKTVVANLRSALAELANARKTILSVYAERGSANETL